MAVSVVGVDKIAPELRDTFLSLGDRAIFLLAEKLSEEAKKNAPRLNSYGQLNRSKVPHRHKQPAGTLQKSIIPTPTIKEKHSWLVNARDWRARFIEFGTKPYKMPATKSPRRKPYAFVNPRSGDGSLVFTKNIRHPGTQGFAFMQRTAEDSVVDRYIRDVIAEINNG